MSDTYTPGERDEYHAEIRRLRDELRAVSDETGRLREAEPPKRVTTTEMLRAFLLRMQTSSTGEHSSVKLNRNAKGDTQVEVSVRTSEAEGIETVEDAAAKARTVYDTLCKLYPLSSPESPK
jgi:hypothetical protein